MYVIMLDSYVAVVLANKNCMAPQCSKRTVTNVDVLCTFHDDSPASIDGPVAAQQRFFGKHERAVGSDESYSIDLYIFYRLLFGSFYLNDIIYYRPFKQGCVGVDACR